ncbi:MAG: hypothetical protein B7Y96_07900, partial [Comamonadaceae bacterium 32-67-11]
KLFLDEANSMVPVDVWNYTEVGSSDDGSDEVKRIFGSSVFDNPKPLPLIEKILSLVPKKNALVLDSFAGSGTTGHAVLSANKKDGGHRKFILVECEAYADSLTAERIRRVSQGYAYQGNHRVELMQRSLTFTDLRNADRLLHDIAAIENLEGSQYDRLDKKVKDGVLLVEGVKQITERMAGLGGGPGRRVHLLHPGCSGGHGPDADRRTPAIVRPVGGLAVPHGHQRGHATRCYGAGSGHGCGLPRRVRPVPRLADLQAGAAVFAVARGRSDHGQGAGFCGRQARQKATGVCPGQVCVAKVAGRGRPSRGVCPAAVGALPRREGLTWPCAIWTTRAACSLHSMRI